MRALLTLIHRLLFCTSLVLPTCVPAQVKPEFLYKTGMPYGTLDIRTNISGSDYYYLKEGETFSFRETSAGVPTKTFLDMTNWDSSPYQEGHLRHKQASSDQFVMNYRFLKPRNYDPAFPDGYPLVLMFHGAYEMANCVYTNWYHSDWNWDPVTNIPAAPTSPDSKLLNNDHSLTIGGLSQLDARNRAGNYLPDSPDLHQRAFPGFVLIPQMLNDWDSLSVENVIRIVLLHTKEYNINMDRIYVHGLSIGGHAVYEAIKRAPWLFSAALPMSAVSDGYIIKQKLQSATANIPLWLFQGGLDTKPTVQTTKAFMQTFQSAGASVRYTEYADLAHEVWPRSYEELEFFQFMLSNNKSKIFALGNVTRIDAASDVFPKLMLSEGFFNYQWERDGKLLPDKAHILVAKEAGSYRARFSRVADPSETEWNRWSEPLMITEEDMVTGIEGPANRPIEFFPNPSSSYGLRFKIDENLTAMLTIFDGVGKQVHREISPAGSNDRKVNSATVLPDGVYIIELEMAGNRIHRRVVIQN